LPPVGRKTPRATGISGWSTKCAETARLWTPLPGGTIHTPAVPLSAIPFTQSHREGVGKGQAASGTTTMGGDLAKEINYRYRPPYALRSPPGRLGGPGLRENRRHRGTPTPVCAASPRKPSTPLPSAGSSPRLGGSGYWWSAARSPRMQRPASQASAGDAGASREAWRAL